MFTHDALHLVRRSLLTLSVACAFVLGAALLTPAAADTPTGWESPPPVSVFDFLLVLVLVPLGVASVIALLAVLPSMASDRGYEPGQSWRGEAEWFGGPTKGVKSAAEMSPEQIEARSKDTGGTSASW